MFGRQRKNPAIFKEVMTVITTTDVLGIAVFHVEDWTFGDVAVKIPEISEVQIQTGLKSKVCDSFTINTGV